MNYIMDLRSLVGSRPLILTGAAALVLDEAGRVLLQRRVDNGAWGLPGGAMEPGERLEETARREVAEETGLTVGTLDLFGIFSGPEVYYRYPNGDEVYNVMFVYVTRSAAGSLRPDGEEGLELRYFAPNDLPGEISPPCRPVLERLRTGGAGEEPASSGQGDLGYTARLRALVGTRPLIQPGAAVVVHDEQGRVLLQRRADNGYWSLPGGFMDPGEYLEETARREVREETGILVGPLTLLEVQSGPEHFVVYPDGNQVYIVCAVYGARAVGGFLSADGHEATDAGFFPPEALPRPIVPVYEKLLRRE